MVRLRWHTLDRAQTAGELEGFIKLIVSQKGDRFWGRISWERTPVN
jgi:pyruvate/2-oxoglutarate dehydrogenase complex dihydrolipoamide dehydrogenase (E3) component